MLCGWGTTGPCTRGGRRGAAWQNPGVTETRWHRSRPLARTWWAVLAVVVALSLVTQFVLSVVDPADAQTSVVTRVIRFFSYFTIQSNLLVLASVLPLMRDSDHDGPVWRGGRAGAARRG